MSGLVKLAAAAAIGATVAGGATALVSTTSHGVKLPNPMYYLP